MMPETEKNIPQNENNFNAGEIAGRLSEEEKTALSHQPVTEEKSQNNYENLKLPEHLKGCELHWQSFKQLAAELELSDETVQKLLDWEAKTTADGRKISDETRSQILAKWTAQTKEIFGPYYQKHVTNALAAAQRFGGEELRMLLDATGLGSHPVIVKTFHEISKQISEDSSVGGMARTGTDKTFTEALYGKTV